MYDQTKTLYNINIKRIIKTLIFAQNCKYLEKEENF